MEIKYIYTIHNFLARKYISRALEYTLHICQIYFGEYIPLLYRKYMQNIF